MSLVPAYFMRVSALASLRLFASLGRIALVREMYWARRSGKYEAGLNLIDQLT